MDRFNIRRLLKGLGLLVVLLLAVAFVLGLLSLQRTSEIVSEDFQQQQLILARTTARQIEDGMEFLRRELKILNYSPAIQYLEEVAWANRMKVSFDDLSKLGVTAIMRIDFHEQRADRAYILDSGGHHIVEQDFNNSPEVVWARDPGNQGRIYQGPIELQQQGEHRVPFFHLATPVYEVSVDESHPKATGNLDGVLLFKVDASQFTGHYCAGIRSGRTGYCWVINREGVFLYHPEKEFIGEDAFTARGRRNPVISFDKINEIQKTKMLAGEEGTAQYISGWHRGVIRKMEKFVAYTQAHIGPECPYAHLDPEVARTQGRPGCAEIWPIAVVAPTDEVYGTIHSLYVRQFLIQGILIFALVLAAAAVIYYEMRWSVELQREVDKTTTDLRRSREQYKSVVENARDFLFLLDEKGNFISANTSAARAWGIPAKAIQGKSLADLLAPDDAASYLSQVRDVVESRKSLELKSAVRIKDRLYWLSTHFVPVFGEDGRTVERVLVMARDITERQRMEEQMSQTEKLASLGTLSAGIAHEINNPLGVIMGFTEILLDRIPPDSKEHEILKTIERQGHNAKKIVEKLMTYARRRSEYEEFTDVNADISNVLLLVQNSLLTSKIDLEPRLAGDLPRVRGDSGELQQVFFNLVNNAIAAMPHGGRLTVITKVNPYSQMVEAIFADTGTGIPKEIADRIFDPFFTTKKVGEGTGLGLSVSYAIVQKYGGDIRFETRLPGGDGGNPGTTFFVSLQPEIAVETRA
ncbi:MAG: PAS domain-containing protein [Deltaproteobacteria bacterium]|nr:PAS domain-containing protein [Deltaproteobacteria bacterium]